MICVYAGPRKLVLGGGSSLESSPFQLRTMSNPYYISYVQSRAIPHACSMRHVVADRKTLQTYDFCEHRLREALDNAIGLAARALLQFPNEESVLLMMRLCHHSIVNEIYAIEEPEISMIRYSHQKVVTVAVWRLEQTVLLIMRRKTVGLA